MARLSAEHFRSQQQGQQPDIPTPKLRSFTKMFKSRGSNSSPFSGAESVRSSPASNALYAQEKLKKGFAKVGLFPSERKSSDGSTVSKESNNTASGAVVMQQEEIKGASAPHSLDTSLMPAAMMRTNRLEEEWGLGRRSMGDKAKKAEFDAGDENEITTIYHGAHGNDEEEQPVAAAIGSHKDISLSTKERFLTKPTSLSFPKEARCEREVDSTSKNRKSAGCEATEVTGQSSSQTSQAQKDRHNSGHQDSHTASGRSSFETKNSQISTKTVKSSTFFYYFDDRAVTLKLGPYCIHNQKLVAGIESALTLTYILILVRAAFSGPLTLFLIIWKAALLVILYEILLRMKGWEDHHAPDMFLEPLHNGVLPSLHDVCAEMGETLGRIISPFVASMVTESEWAIKERRGGWEH